MTKLITGATIGIGALGFAAVCSKAWQEGRFYVAVDDAVAFVEEQKKPVAPDVLDALQQKCGGKSYTIAAEDYPGRYEFHYDAQKGTYQISPGLSASGVMKCEQWGNYSCDTYASDHAPTKTIYIDDTGDNKKGGDGWLDRIEKYRQNRDGTEHLMSSTPFSLDQKPVQDALEKRLTDAFGHAAVDHMDGAISIIQDERDDLLHTQDIFAEQMTWFSRRNPNDFGIVQFTCSP